MDSPPRTLLLLSLSLLNLFLPTPPVSAQSTTFDFPSFSIRNLTLLGDSYLRNGSVGLTRQTGVPTSSSGTAACNLPVRFYDPATGASASFSTKFSFSVTNLNPGSCGDGLAFFISPDNSTLGSTGGYLGVFNSSAAAAAKNGSIVLAVEFDTWLDEGLGDPSANHVGLDIDGPKSVETADLEPYGIELKSGNLITAWIDYDDDEGSLRVWLGCSSGKPEIPVLSTRYNLSKHFKEFMYVGFSASTEGSTEVHVIESWSFRTFGFPTLNLAPYAPYNKSVGSWSAIPAIPVAGPHDDARKILGYGLAIMGPLALGLAFVGLVAVTIKRWKRMDGGFDQEILKGPRRFSYRELSAATRGFHSSRIVGNGAFGTVYRAIHPASGVTYAVKRSKQAQQGKGEFMAELSAIGCLRHKNLVQLEGWCCEKGELLLVYEFMPNGSLDRALYRGPGSSGPCSILKWGQRYNVAIGTASILTYLHQECEKLVIHRDIKTSNVMLDADFSPRLGDFGLARLTDHNKSPVSTLTAGTMGYLAPEYLQYGKATEKTDVFSYGVVILEVCCGRRPIDKEDGEDQKVVNLVDWVWGLYSRGRLIEAADRRLNGEFDKEEMLRLLLVGLSCANPNWAERPSMRRVIQILKSEAEPMVVPKTKPLLVFTSGTSLSLKEIVSDCDESAESSPLYELK